MVWPSYSSMVKKIIGYVIGGLVGTFFLFLLLLGFCQGCCRYVSG
jgi:hypothetical protein